MTYADHGSLMAIAIFFMDLNTILIVLRYITVRMKQQPIGPDGIALGISWFLATAMCILMITAASFGIWGRPILPPSLEDLETDPNAAYFMNQYYDLVAQAAKFFYVQEALLVPQLALTKLSILFFYRRVLVPQKRGLTHWALLAAVGVVSLWGVIFFLVYVFQCGTHVSIIWQPATTPEQADINAQYCVSAYLDTIFVATDVFLDTVVLALPFYQVSKLQLSTVQAPQVAAAFVVGGLSLIGAVVRLAANVSVDLNIENAFTEPLYAEPESAMMFWAIFESGFAVTVACLPGIRPLVNRGLHAFDRRWSTFRSKSSPSDSPSQEYLGSIIVNRGYQVTVEYRLPKDDFGGGAGRGYAGLPLDV